MTTSEQFGDKEMAAFFDTEMQKQIDSMQVEHEHSIVAERLWKAVADLDMDLAVSQNPAAHEDDFSDLIEVVGEIVDTLPPHDEPDYSRDQHIHAIANSIWDEQISMLEQISLALDMQLHGNLPDDEKKVMKKKLMARIIVRGEGQEQWLALADTALDGDPIDRNTPEDFDMIAEALEIAANLENTPEVKFYDSILTLLGVPDLSQDIPDGYDMEQIELLTYAARDIVEAAICKISQTQQPDRHSTIREVADAYGLIESIDLPRVLQLADAYAEQKTSTE